MRQPEQTYAELAERRAQEWAQAQARAAAAIAQRHKEISQMPDVVNRPAVGDLWNPAGLKCPTDNNPTFRVLRYVTINGILYRTQLQCANGDYNGTYDWQTYTWL